MTNNKANKSKILALILGLTMCLALMLGIVFASPTFAAHAEGGTDEILEIKGDTDVTSTDGKYRYTVSDKTLILKDYNGKQIRLNDDATINLQGNNVINIDENSHFYTAIPNRYWEATGIKADKSLTITGSGTLTINIDITNKENDENAGSMLSSHGIYSNGDLTIKGSVGITITHKELGEDYGYAIAAKNNLNIIDSASIDINTVSTALYANDGNIKLSGTGEKKIKIDRERVQWDTANAVYTSQGSVDISGTGKVILEKVNGFTVYAIYARWKPINLHDNANVEINGFNRAMLSPKGIDINKSTVKIVSTGETSSAFSASDKTIQIQNSAVYVDVGGEFIYTYNGSGLPELQILGKSTVYVNCSNPAMCGDEGKTIRKYFALSEGGSISLINRSYPTVWAELGDGTNLEVGTKLGPSATNPTWFEYKSSDTYNGYGLTRFVYGDTSKASATINDVTIKGIQDETMSDTDVKITLTGDTFKAIAKDTDVTAWFKNMPKGLTAKVKEAVADNSTEMIITVNGIPENVLVESVWLEIPATAFTATNYGMTAEFNRNAKYEIVTSKLVDVPTPVSGLVYNGEWQEGVPATEAYTVANGGEESAGTYTAKLYLKPGYKWSDGTTEMKTVEWSIAPKPIEIDVVLEKTEYVYTGYEITPIYRVGVGTEGISNLSSSEYSVELKNNKEIGENTASITISNKTGGDYEIKNPVTKYFSIIKPVRNAPEGLKGVAPTTEGGSDGKITGQPPIWNIPPIRRSLHLPLVRILKQPDLPKECITFATRQLPR